MDLVTIAILLIIGFLIFLMFRADKSSDGKLDLKLGFAKQTDIDALKKEIELLKKNTGSGLTRDQVLQILNQELQPLHDELSTKLTERGFTAQEIQTAIEICKYLASKSTSNPDFPQFTKVTIRRRPTS